MLETCTLCKREFLTEADPYVVRPTPQGYKLYCFCQIKGFDEVTSAVEEIKKDLRHVIKDLRANVDSDTQEWHEAKEILAKWEAR
jgi:hypothetical protein